MPNEPHSLAAPLGVIIACEPGEGCYCQANWHPHCLRPFPPVLWFDERL